MANSIPNKAEEFINNKFPKREISKILLVNPPDADSTLFRDDTAKRHRYTNYPPYGLAVLATQLRAINITVKITNLNDEILNKCINAESPELFDFNTIWQGKIKKEIEFFQPDLVGVTCMFNMTHQSFVDVCKYVSQFDIPLALGGVHVTNETTKGLIDIPEADVIFLNEADHSMPQFVKWVNQSCTHQDVSSVLLNHSGRQIKLHNGSAPTSDDISVIPSYDLLKISEYSSRGTIGAFYCFKPPTTGFATVLSNRGCRAKCTFCSVHNFNGPGVRQRSIESVIDEIEILHDQYGIGHIVWLDDDLFKDHRRAIQLFSEISKRKLDMTWDATNGVLAASCVDEVIAAAEASGCIALNIGVESGNEKILREVRKPATVNVYLKAADVLRKYEKIHTSVFLMIGFPGESMSMIMDTINLAKSMDMDWYRISQLQPLPNTPIYDAMVEQGLIKDAGNKIRFMGGAYGKQTELEQGLRLTSVNFEEAFSSIRLNDIPNSEQLTDIWFYMNYHLNFRRLFFEDRLIKIKQQMQNLEILGDVISPENGFALYFMAYLQNKIEGKINPEIIDRLEKRLATSDYWNDRFNTFGLSATDLRTRTFENEQDTLLVSR